MVRFEYLIVQFRSLRRFRRLRWHLRGAETGKITSFVRLSRSMLRAAERTHPRGESIHLLEHILLYFDFLERSSAAWVLQVRAIEFRKLERLTLPLRQHLLIPLPTSAAAGRLRSLRHDLYRC